MFTLLDGLNRFLGYFNLKIKVKNRLYSILGCITTWYIGYLTWNFFEYQAYGRAITYSVIFLILLYFLILNILYYFFDKNVKWDITPFFEKFAQVDSTIEPDKTKSEKKSGLYADQMVIYDETQQNLDDYQAFDTTLVYLEDSQKKLEQLIDFMLKNHLAEKSKKMTKKKSGRKKSSKKVYEIGEGVLIPSFTMEIVQEDLFLSIGLNATERVKVAQVEKIGELSVSKMRENYTIVAKTAKIIGGNYEEVKNGNIQKGTEPYQIQLKVACLVKIEGTE